jgi:hypothetical protein
MSFYFLDGKKAHGEDYVPAIDSVAAAPTDDPAWVCVRVPGVGSLVISTGLDGLSIEDERSDGSSWTKYEVTKDQAKDLVAELLNGSTDWRADPGWELTGYAPKAARRRMLWIVCVGVILGAIVWSLLKLMTG